MIPTHHLVWSRRSASPAPVSTSVSIFEPSRFAAHHPHSFAVAPVELAVRLIEMELLRRERAALWDDDLRLLAVEVGALDRAVVQVGNAHIGPVDMAASASTTMPSGRRQSVDDDLAVGAVRIHREDPATAHSRTNSRPSRAFAAR